MRLLSTLGLAAVIAALSSGCRPACDSSTCSGCCENDTCYLGGCGGALGGGSGAGGGTGGGSAAACAGEHESCASKACCAKNASSNALSCLSNHVCGTTCATFFNACNAANPCCKDTPTSSTDYFCDTTRSRCDLCSRKGHTCYTAGSTDECCAGLACASKIGFPGYLECQ